VRHKIATQIVPIRETDSRVLSTDVTWLVEFNVRPREYLLNLRVVFIRRFLVFFLLVLPVSEIFAQPTSDSRITIHVKFKDELTQQLPRQNKVSRFGFSPVDEVATANDVVSIQRVFPDAGKYEEAHRAYGLHLWYEMKFERQVMADRVMQALQGTSYFEMVEQPKSYAHHDLDGPVLPSGSQDSQLKNQWYLKNTRQLGGVVGADIKGVEAWTLETGKSSVIVGVIDGGIDFSHQDLNGSQWVNSDEIPNNGIDDDHNGYIDDYNGYGFGDQSAVIPADLHATHVAGIIAARTNNGIGIAGIAGGSGNGDGVRLMSLAAFGSTHNGGFEEAMVYAADNGAVILQNSWGGGSSAIEVAINYFIDRAGYDNTAVNFSKSIKIGPIAGGTVVFAAGNKNSDDPSLGYPGSLPTVIAVAATNESDRKTGLSNYGSWVDIAAPGQDIISTVPGSTYGWNSGTSMACPMVSATVALIISRYSPNVNTQQVINRLFYSADPLNTADPYFGTQLGAGRLNAFKALTAPDGILPGAITDLSASGLFFDRLTLHWTSHGANGESGIPARYDVRMNTVPITDANFSGSQPLKFLDRPASSGTAESLYVSNLLPSTTYYFAIKVVDFSLEQSNLSNVVEIVTPGKPILSLPQNSLELTLAAEAHADRALTLSNTGEGPLVAEVELRYTMGDATLPFARYHDPAKAKLFAANSTTMTIDQLDPATGKIVHSIPYPEITTSVMIGLAFDGTSLYFGFADSHRIYKLDPSTGAVLGSIVLPASTTLDGLGFSGEFLYVQDRGSLKIHKVDFETGTLVTLPSTVPTYSGGLSFGGSYGTLYGSANTKLYSFNRATGAVIKSLTMPTAITGLAYSEGADVLFVALAGTAGIRLLDPLTLATRSTWPSPYLGGLAADEAAYHWASLGTRSVTIPAGTSFDLPLTFSAESLPAGSFGASLKIEINDPTVELITVPITLSVSAAPNLRTSRSSIDFGKRYLGTSVDSLLVITSNGMGTIDISSITSTNPHFFVTPTNMTLAQGASDTVRVRFDPQTAAEETGEIQLVSNDPDQPITHVNLHSTVYGIPIIHTLPDSIGTTLILGDEANFNLSIQNPGQGPLNWMAAIEGSAIDDGSLTPQPGDSTVVPEFTTLPNIPFAATGLVNDPTTSYIYAMTATNVIRFDPRNNVWSIYDAAPPSSVGAQGVYEQGKLYYAGSSLHSYDIAAKVWTSVAYPPDYPSGSSSANVASDGTHIYTIKNKLFQYTPSTQEWASFAPPPLSGIGGLSHRNGVLYCTSNSQHPSLSKYYIAEDLWVDGAGVPGAALSGTAATSLIDNKFVVGSGSNLYLYDMRTDSWETASLGGSFTMGLGMLTYVGVAGISGFYIGGGTAFKRLNTSASSAWLSLSSPSGQLNAGESESISIKIKGVAEGDFQGSVKLTSSNPVLSTSVPITMHVPGAPDIWIDRDSVDLSFRAYVGYYKYTSIKIKNLGTDRLEILDVQISDPQITLPFTSTSVRPGQTLTTKIGLTASTDTPQYFLVTLVTNDPDEPEVKIKVTAKASLPPEIQFSLDTINVELYSRGSTTFDLVVSNAGSGPMDATAFYSSNFVSAPQSDTYIKLAPGESHVVPITVKAASFVPGTYQVLFDVEQNPFVGLLVINLTIIAAPNISPDKGKIDFGEVYVGRQRKANIRITNNGASSLNLTAANLSNNYFQVTGFNPATVAPNKFVTVVVEYTAAAVGDWADTLELASNDPDANIVSVPIHATSIYPPIANVDSSPMTVDVTLINPLASRVFDIINSGLTNLHWTITQPAASWLTIDHKSGTLLPSASDSVSMVFDATGLHDGMYPISIIFQSSDSTLGSVNIPVTLHVINTGSEVAVSKTSLTASTIHTIPVNQVLTLQNKGVGDLIWSFGTEFPSWLSLSKSDGTLLGNSSEDIQVMFKPNGLSGTYKDTLSLISNDSYNPFIKFPISLAIAPNVPPKLISNFNPTYLDVAQIKEVTVIDKFIDTDGDSLTYWTDADTTIVQSSWIGNKLSLKGLKEGTTTMFIYADDNAGGLAHDQFPVTVRDKTITGLPEREPTAKILGTPNPFDNRLQIQFDSLGLNGWKVIISDVQGRVVWTMVDPLATKSIVLDIETKTWSPGLYLLQFVQDDKAITALRLIKIN